MAPMGIFSFVH